MNLHDESLNVLALIKGEDRFVFLFDDRSLPAFLQQLGRLAANPEFNFTWEDAAFLSAKARGLLGHKEREIDD